MEKSPILIETGTKYFMKETLKNCRELKQNYYNKFINLILLLILISIISGFLYYKKKTRLTPKEKKQKHMEKESFFLNKIKQIRENKRKKNNDLITDLPQFESHFEVLHKKYYKG